MALDRETCRWSFSVNVEELHASGTRKRIVELLRNSAEGLKRKDIIEKTGLSIDTVKKQLERLVKDGKVLKTDRATYLLATVGIDAQHEPEVDPLATPMPSDG